MKNSAPRHPSVQKRHVLSLVCLSAQAWWKHSNQDQPLPQTRVPYSIPGQAACLLSLPMLEVLPQTPFLGQQTAHDFRDTVWCLVLKEVPVALGVCVHLCAHWAASVPHHAAASPLLHFSPSSALVPPSSSIPGLLWSP